MTACHEVKYKPLEFLDRCLQDMVNIASLSFWILPPVDENGPVMKKKSRENLQKKRKERALST